MNKMNKIFLSLVMLFVLFCTDNALSEFINYKYEKINGYTLFLNNNGYMLTEDNSDNELIYSLYKNGEYKEILRVPNQDNLDAYDERMQGDVLGFSDNNEMFFSTDQYEKDNITHIKRYYIVNSMGEKHLVHQQEIHLNDYVTPPGSVTYETIQMMKNGNFIGFSSVYPNSNCRMINWESICIEQDLEGVYAQVVTDINIHGVAVGYRSFYMSSFIEPVLYKGGAISLITPLVSAYYGGNPIIADNGDIVAGGIFFTKSGNYDLQALPYVGTFRSMTITDDEMVIAKDYYNGTPIIFKNGEQLSIIHNSIPPCIEYVVDANVKGQFMGRCDFTGPSFLATPTTLQANKSRKNLGIPNLSNPETPSPIICNPINSATGNKVLLETDLSANSNSLPLLQRYYNSFDPIATGYGKGWRSTYHRSIKSSGVTAQVTREDGRVDNFLLSAGAWIADPDVTSQLRDVQNGWDLKRNNDTTEHYDQTGKLLSIENRSGQTTNLNYDDSNRLTTVTGPFGHILHFSYDSSNRINQVTYPDEKTITYDYDINDNLISVTFSDDKIRKYLYENSAYPNALTGIIDENNIRFATYSYDDKGRAVSTEHAGGTQKATLTYNSDGTTLVTNALGKSSNYSFTTQFEMVKPALKTNQSCNCGSSAFTYDSNGFLSTQTDFNGTTTTYTRDARGQELTRTEASGTPQAHTITTTWDETYHRPLSITEPNRTTTFTYDEKGNLLTKTITGGGKTRSWSYTYNSFGQTLSETDPLGKTTTYTYNGQGGVATITNALDQTTTISSYDSNGRPLQIEEPNNLITTLAYDVRGRLISQIRGVEQTTYNYDDVGQLTKITMPNGAFISYTYDPAHRLTGIADAMGNHITYTLDAMSNRTKEEIFDAKGILSSTKSFAYDSLNQLAKTIGAQNQETMYGYVYGNVTSITDPLNHTTQNTYDPLNRLIQSIDPNNKPASIDYNVDDLPTTVTDARGVTTTYVYDELGNPVSSTSRDSGTTTRTFDASGNVLTSTDARGKTTAYSYDGLGRVTSATFADGESIAYQYDQGTGGIGKLTKITDASGSATWNYDLHGRVLQKQQVTGSITLTTTYQYDPGSGQLISVTYPSGKTVSYEYGDASGLPTGIKVGSDNLLSAIRYTPSGPVSSWSFGNGSSYERHFDLDGRISTITITGGASDTIQYTYDAANRITKVTDTSPSVNVASGGSSHVYADDSNRLLNSTGDIAQNYTYDAAGNILQDGSRTYSYDAQGRLAQVTSGGNTTDYAINGLGQRVKKSGPGVVTGANLFTYDEAGHLTGEYDATGLPVREIVWLQDMPVAILQDGSRYYVNSDHLGVPRSITNQDDQVVWKWIHDPYGNDQPIQSTEQSFTCNLRFPGQYYDSESGLHYNYYRDYDPKIGRYVQSDPIGLAGGSNTYGYAGNDPINNIDSSGQSFATLTIGAIAGGATGYVAAESGNKLPGFLIGFGTGAIVATFPAKTSIVVKHIASIFIAGGGGVAYNYFGDKQSLSDGVWRSMAVAGIAPLISGAALIEWGGGEGILLESLVATNNSLAEVALSIMGDGLARKNSGMCPVNPDVFNNL